MPAAVVAHRRRDLGRDRRRPHRLVEVDDAQALELGELVQGGVDVVDVGLV